MPDELATLLANAATADADGAAPATPATKPEGSRRRRRPPIGRTASRGFSVRWPKRTAPSSDLQRQMEEVRIVLSEEDERDASRSRREADELAALRAENELLKLAAEPKYASVYEPFAKCSRRATPRSNWIHARNCSHPRRRRRPGDGAGNAARGHEQPPPDRPPPPSLTGGDERTNSPAASLTRHPARPLSH